MPVVAAVGTVLLLVFLLWFAVGTQRNISRGNDLLRWLQQGLPDLGPRTTLRWLGSSAVQLDIAQAQPPFTAAQINVVLEPRDIGWLWAWARRRGRRDFLVLRGTIDGPPRFEMEVGGQRGWTGSDRLERLDPDAWEQTMWEDAGGPVELAHSGRAEASDVAAVRQLWERLGGSDRTVWRVSIRNQAPQIEVHVEPPGTTNTLGRKPANTEGKALVEAFRKLGELASQ